MHSDLTTLRIALVGAPNCGKTTLYNWLTGSKFRTVNYPGSTVEYSVGTLLNTYNFAAEVMDTPGTYSLAPKSPEEVVTYNALFHHPGGKPYPDAVVVVLDATQLSRHFLIFSHLKEAGFAVIAAVTMTDLLKTQGFEISAAALSKEIGAPVVLIDGRLGGGVKTLTEKTRQLIETNQNTPQKMPVFEPWSSEKTETELRRYSEVEKKVREELRETYRISKTRSVSERSESIDRVLMHPFWGLVLFVLIMGSLFTSIFWLAQPVMDLVDQWFSELAQLVLSLGPQYLIVDFLANGVIASLGAVLVFVPQIAILFFGLMLLEDSGYLARASALIDKPLSKVGLNGKSFVPLLSAHACAVPAMMAARTISSRKERWLTLFVVPLMTCSARLPVYALLLSFVFKNAPAWQGGLALTAIYFGSIVFGGIASLIASHFIRYRDTSLFMLEIPFYRRPQLKPVLKNVTSRVGSYVRRAGPVIFLLSIIIWASTTFPHYSIEDRSARLSESYMAKVGHAIEPVMKPMGVDWRVGVGLISAFAAREVFVSTLAIIFNVTTPDNGAANEDSLQQSLLSTMETATTDHGIPIFTLATVAGLIIYFMIALQCIATVGIAHRESGSWKFAAFQVVAFNTIAYILAVSVVQGLRFFGIT